ncbi:adenine phosphoribosyltransferase [Psychrobium sp. 1_MG-2023]|uniref:adenine phosphoribosyltransferase n=1 Tax=Psychrobium sp. 1_MG-2023 TaxID=3062624 RepID=UPI000C332D69|nr:adenine phosphoribosyltransferase [Psychrobium sp. 1_MG-2023]MDP2561662.1 adenine phosphoribosyltransferase [Psychrobium sp. 1_MG-2023]PKF57067.1 adenine phosphoribosyltransferase [Alteromonadales bacterium alter-6D02]
MNQQSLTLIKDSIKAIADYPKPGIMFRDVTSLLEDPQAFQLVIDLLAQEYKDQGITKIVGTEARGFIFGAPLALALNVGFVPARKPGKLPRPTLSQDYTLEYGQDTLQIHKDSLTAADKVLIVDDLLATGGTVEATVKLIRQVGATVNDAAFVITLPDLGGETRLESLELNLTTLVSFDGE